jgi:hypothetical protein
MTEGLPEASLLYFRSLIEEVSGEELVDAAKGIPELAKGFRPGHIDLKTLRQRALAAYGKSPKSSAMLGLLRNLSLQRPLIAVLSEEALRYGEMPFTRYFGAVPFFSAMSVDPRPTVARYGLSKLKELRVEAAPTINPAAAKQIIDDFKPFLETLRSVIDAAAGAEPRPRGNHRPHETEAPEGSSKLSSIQIQKLVEGSPTVRRLRRELTVSKGRLDEVTGRWKALDARYTDLEQKHRDAETELTRIRGGFETALSDRIEDLFDKRLGLLFTRTSVVTLRSDEAADGQGGGAIATARRVLAAQAIEDTRYGTRTALGKELHDARTLRDALLEAQLEALRPLPEMRQAVSALDRLIGDIETRLGVTRLVPRNSSDHLKRFLTEVRSTRTISEIAQKRNQLEAIRTSNQWGSEEISAAEEALSVAALQHYEGYLDGISDRDADLLANASPLNALRVALIKTIPVRIVIDGHNVLYQLRPIWGQHFEEGIPGARAREHLTKRLAELCGLYPSVSVDLWFDSGVRQQETISSRMRVLYSGGEGADRADNAISEALEHIHRSRAHSTKRSSTRHDLFVVSADRDVRASAGRCHAIAMYPTELAAVLGG